MNTFEQRNIFNETYLFDVRVCKNYFDNTRGSWYKMKNIWKIIITRCINLCNSIDKALKRLYKQE